MELTPNDILDGFGGETKRYGTDAPIAGVEILPLRRIVDDRGLFMEIYRNSATHPGSEALASFFTGVDVAQLNYSLVTTSDHVKGLHFHLKQSDVWFCPPPSKLKVVLLDARKNSPTSGRTQVVVLGEGRDALAEDPAGRGARLPPAHRAVRPPLRGHALFRPRRPRRAPHPLGPPGGEGPLGGQERVAPRGAARRRFIPASNCRAGPAPRRWSRPAARPRGPSPARPRRSGGRGRTAACRQPTAPPRATDAAARRAT